MAILIPPPPTNAAQGDRVWTDWYIRLSQVLSSTAGIAWALVDKTGSSLADIVTRDHSLLSSILGNGHYHMSLDEQLVVEDIEASGHQGLTNILGTGDKHISTAEAAVLTDIEVDGHQGLTDINGTGDNHISTAEAAIITNLEATGTLPITSDTNNPTTSDIADGYFAVHRNTSLGEIRLWVNDGGVMKKSAALT